MGGRDEGAEDDGRTMVANVIFVDGNSPFSIGFQFCVVEKLHEKLHGPPLKYNFAHQGGVGGSFAHQGWGGWVIRPRQNVWASRNLFMLGIPTCIQDFLHKVDRK